MHILVIDPDENRAALVIEGLKADAQDARLHYAAQFELMTLQTLNPDMVIISCESPDRDTLDALQLAHEAVPRPVVMFVDRSDTNTTAKALSAGVAAYIVDGFNPQRIAHILDIATHQFNQIQALRTDLNKARADLASRKLIDRAKGILMQHRQISEEDAYRLMRKHAMDQGKSMASVAQEIISMADLLGAKGIA